MGWGFIDFDYDFDASTWARPNFNQAHLTRTDAKWSQFLKTPAPMIAALINHNHMKPEKVFGPESNDDIIINT